MIVEIVAVGTELLLGQIVNSNAAEIGSRLAEAGLDHYRQTVVGDNLDRMAAALREAMERADAVVVTGGIGPTQDDITREAMCAAAGVPMVFDEAFAGLLRERWARRGWEMPESNLRQAEHPEGAVMIPNPRGTAPGLRLRAGDAWLIALPGVPQEMLPMLEESVIPFLVAEAGGDGSVLVSRVIRTWGLPESRVAEMLGDLFAAAGNPTMAFLASAGEIKVRLTARAPDDRAAAALLDPLEAVVRERLGRRVFAVGGDPIEAIVLGLLAERGWTVGTAESATGGLLAARLTGVPGASASYVGSIVAYTARAKQDLLGVPAAVLEEHGLVSEETALAMAAGAAGRLPADVVVAVTGSAGPEPLEAPVGTIVVAVQTPEGAAARVLRLPPDRERARTLGSTGALHLLRRALLGEWWRT
ncbi:MAG: competence/damage-inducible protein A [Actinobacteria bacterium]|nr:competence/damage-inducible protein A [Actinomycetota bacterium]